MHTILSESIGFNLAPPHIMLLDINSCFATIEQQANPLLRGRPVVVGAYTTDRGCVLAASREAKKLGIKTGMYVGEAKKICPDIAILFPDSDKYRFVNKQLVKLLSSYTDPIEVKSIDEMAFSFASSYYLERMCRTGATVQEAMRAIAYDIKQRIRDEIGDWITVSIGIAPNRYLAKIGASHYKPDGLILIDHTNIETILKTMRLEDLTGIKMANATRLRAFGIMTPLMIYNANIKQLKTAFHSILGYHWWLRLHGWEADSPRWSSGEAGDREFERKTLGHSYALRKPLRTHDSELKHILYQLIVKMGRRLRIDNLTAQGVHVSCYFGKEGGWGHSEKQKDRLFTDADFYRVAEKILKQAPNGLVRILAVSCFDLQEDLYAQQSLFAEDDKKCELIKAMDKIAERWGEWTLVPGRLLNIKQQVHDRIAFGSAASIKFSMRNI